MYGDVMDDVFEMTCKEFCFLLSLTTVKQLLVI